MGRLDNQAQRAGKDRGREGGENFGPVLGPQGESLTGTLLALPNQSS